MRIVLLFCLFCLYYVNGFKTVLKDNSPLQMFKKRSSDVGFRNNRNNGTFLRTQKRGTSLKGTFDDIKKIISKQLSVEEDKIKTESNFTKDLGADSLDLVELIMALEENFKITISDQDALKINTVQDAIDFIEKNKKTDA
ncbi:acyl carrier protein, putative [Plasmodium ovale]|uniref:Acyl carrier protein n=1 Tax=Plasmodium ovale TaxID=36330 RepID=A0A1D3RD81_PLAOA|nr:acyl carrier protein, putative [Plasmodium ovale]